MKKEICRDGYVIIYGEDITDCNNVKICKVPLVEVCTGEIVDFISYSLVDARDIVDHARNSVDYKPA